MAYVAQNGMNMNQWELTSFLVPFALKKNTNLLDQVVHRSSPVIQLIKSRTEQSIFVEIDPYIAKFGPYFIHYLRQSIILLNVMVDHFDTGPDCKTHSPGISKGSFREFDLTLKISL